MPNDSHGAGDIPLLSLKSENRDEKDEAEEGDDSEQRVPRKKTADAGRKWISFGGCGSEKPKLKSALSVRYDSLEEDLESKR